MTTLYVMQMFTTLYCYNISQICYSKIALGLIVKISDLFIKKSIRISHYYFRCCTCFGGAKKKKPPKNKSSNNRTAQSEERKKWYRQSGRGEGAQAGKDAVLLRSLDSNIHQSKPTTAVVNESSTKTEQTVDDGKQKDHKKTSVRYKRYRDES